MLQVGWAEAVHDDVWSAFTNTYAGDSRNLDNYGQDTRLSKPEFLDAKFTSIEWAIVAREQQRRAKMDAQRAGQLLYYIQAVDQHRLLRKRESYMRTRRYGYS